MADGGFWIGRKTLSELLQSASIVEKCVFEVKRKLVYKSVFYLKFADLAIKWFSLIFSAIGQRGFALFTNNRPSLILSELVLTFRQISFLICPTANTTILHTNGRFEKYNFSMKLLPFLHLDFECTYDYTIQSIFWHENE